MAGAGRPLSHPVAQKRGIWMGNGRSHSKFRAQRQGTFKGTSHGWVTRTVEADSLGACGCL